MFYDRDDATFHSRRTSSLKTGIALRAIVPLSFALPGAKFLLAKNDADQRAVKIHLLLQGMTMVANSQLRRDLGGDFPSITTESKSNCICYLLQKPVSCRFVDD